LISVAGGGDTVAALNQAGAADSFTFLSTAGGAVLDGRDIGTVICPEAEVKLYVTASPEIRAHRRWLEVGGDEAQVLAEVRERDTRDMGRADAPLRPAADAVVLDTSALSAAEAEAMAAALIGLRIAAAQGGQAQAQTSV
ncbi:(d)CMP kinase, partial [Xinfangfangia pollutisoli]|uniref:(d)CMP kinase n=1 Tax=Xinfangfangia pollutisoli TaxID=2865960 RepID=UPI001CD1F65D